jgi:hypothetical protein
MLDGYIANDLGREERAQFAAHLEGCSPCRQAVHAERRLNALLAEALTQREVVPADLGTRVSRRLRSARHRRLAARIILAGASLAACVFLGIRLVSHRAPMEHTLTKVEPRAQAPERPPAVGRVRVTFDEASGVLAVPIPTDSPNITFIHVYSGLRRSAGGGRGPESQVSTPERSIP